jgi:hypothetical protein
MKENKKEPGLAGGGARFQEIVALGRVGEDGDGQGIIGKTLRGVSVENIDVGEVDKCERDRQQKNQTLGAKTESKGQRTKRKD